VKSRVPSIRSAARALALAQLGALALVALLGRWQGAGVDASRAQTQLARATPAEVFAWWGMATQNTVALVFGATFVAALLGGLLGASGVYGDRGIGGLLRGLIEFLGGVPALILAGILRLADPSGGALGLFATLSMLRTLEIAQLVRAQVLEVLSSDFVEASRALGASRRWQLRVHVWPRLLQPLAINLLLGAATLVGLEAALTFAGLGLPSRMPSWGGGLAALYSGGNGGALTLLIASVGSTCAALYGLAALLERRQRQSPGYAPRASRRWRTLARNGSGVK
jgi:ABC-type dipeptide/oligopeptide/nickel transport system permease subunit